MKINNPLDLLLWRLNPSANSKLAHHLKFKKSKICTRRLQIKNFKKTIPTKSGHYNYESYFEVVKNQKIKFQKFQKVYKEASNKKV